jgi:MFS family permease
LTALGLLLLFLGVYTCQPLVFLLIGRHAPKESLGSASSFYILFCIGSGSLSSILLGPIWSSYGWHGITIFCSGALLISLLFVLAMALKVGEMKGGKPEMNQNQENHKDQKTLVVAQIAELSRLLGMIPSDDTVLLREPLTSKSMVLSDWLRATRASLLKLSLLISKELDIQIQ